MFSNEPSLDWLSDVSVFKVNRLEAHSDHRYYKTMEEAERQAPMELRHSLNGDWKFSYAVNAASRIQDFYKADYNTRGWGTFRCPVISSFRGTVSRNMPTRCIPGTGLMLCGRRRFRRRAIRWGVM